MVSPSHSTFKGKDSPHAFPPPRKNSTSCATPGSTRPSGWTGCAPRKRKKPAFRCAPCAKPGHEAELKKRTLTNLYNARPAWLANAHRELDQAVAAAYGWEDYTPEMPDEEILRRLLALNLERSSGKSVYPSWPACETISHANV